MMMEDDLPAIGQSTTGCPVQLKRTVGVGDHGAVEGQGFRRGGGVGKVDEAVSRIASLGISTALTSIIGCQEVEAVGDGGRARTQNTYHGSSSR